MTIRGVEALKKISKKIRAEIQEKQFIFNIVGV